MGTYNPNLPQILGQEWVPIQDELLILTPDVNLVEVGHGFSLSHSSIIQTARFYVNTYPPGDPSTQAIFASVYNRGTESLSGPVRSVIVPCSLGTVTLGSMTISGASTIAQALADPSDSAALLANTGSLAQFSLRFETESYMPMLIGKRILNIDFLYASYTDNADDPPVEVSIGINSTGANIRNLGTLAPTSEGDQVFNLRIGRVKVGEVDYQWNAPSVTSEKLPWSPNRLRCFDNSSGLTDRFILITMGSATTASQTVAFDYAALEIFFCEEQRVLWGGKLFSGGAPYILGANQITMRDLSDAANPTLAVGDYDLVISSPNQQRDNAVAFPELEQVRELYSILPHPPVRTIVPFPVDPTALGKTFQSEQTLLLPQLSLHTSGGPITDVHVYGQQAVAQVYGSITATQEILDSALGANYQYPWVRYYARRFGNTVVPLKLDSPTITGSSVELLPSELDELDEIVDGWREVTLRFDTPPTMGAGTNPQWRWSAAGETAGNRWEILGATAPALSGAAGNLFNKVPSPHQLSLATYGAPVSGANINLGWIPQYAPPVSATVDDQTSDAALIFARDMPTITGFGSSIQDQEVTGIGLDCGLDPCCIPSEIQYVNLSWGPAQTIILTDSFTRADVVDGWGTAESGQAWIVDPPNTDYSVSGGYGVYLINGVTDLFSYTVNNFPDVDITARFRLDQQPTGNDIIPGLMARQTVVGDTYYRGDVRIDSDTGSMTLRIQRAVGAVFTVLTSVTLGPVFDPDRFYRLRFQVIGSTLALRFWLDGETEPLSWNLFTTDTSITSGATGVTTAVLAGNTNVNAHVYWDDIVAGSPWALGTKVELQRRDTVETDWNTIMMSTNPAASGFRDYEARVGIESTYRVRLVDLYDFPGPWSAEVTATIPAPGVTIGCDDGHLLIFTSNEEQDGSVNLAYSSVWEQGRSVEESFLFPESQFVQLQAVYNRDFFIAFRPRERGGEQFARTVLVQAAAISPETLADFTSLRDMAWADVSYICVRDEDGNRWLATVLVPSGRVLRDRRLYLAPVEVIEVTSTPSQVDP